MKEKDLIGKTSDGPKDNICNETSQTKNVAEHDKKFSKKKGIFKYIDFKVMVWYPGIILSSAWTILNIAKIVGYAN